MSRVRFAAVVLVWACVWGPGEPGALRRAAAAETRPNVVLVLADDLGYGELGCYGNAAAVTPHLDRFATQGLRLTDCHSAGSVCSPSRSALLTGRHPYRTGVFTWIPEGSPIHLRTSERALPKLLAEAGYDTCHVGKWHLNGLFNAPEQPQPNDHGYAWWLGTQNNADPSHAFPTNFVRNGTPVGKADDHSAPFIVSEAIEWLGKRSDREKPFFLAVWMHEPHYPIASADRYEKLHAGVADPVERTYRANVTQLDDAFGRLMKALDDRGLADSTLVFFTSDNGPEGDGVKGPGRGLTGGLRGRKRSMYEGGHRVPGIVRWPGRIRPGTTSAAPVVGSDFFPTVLAAAGIDPPEDRTLDGANLLPVFAGGTAARTEPLYWRWGGKVAYREDDWKIVVDESLEKPELFDLALDRDEKNDLAAKEPERLAALMAHLRAHTAEIEAEGPDWWRKEPLNGRGRPRPAERRQPQPAAPSSSSAGRVRGTLVAAPKKTPAGDAEGPAAEAGEDFTRYAIFAATAPRPEACPPGTTTLPLALGRGDRICLVGNTLFERAQLFGHFPALLHASFPEHELVVRTLAWSGDEIDLAPRPDNFADLEQHLAWVGADVVFAAYGFNESFAGEAGLPEFRRKLGDFLARLSSRACADGRAPRIVLVSPIANENVAGVAAADRNNPAILLYTDCMREVARERGVGFVDVFTPTRDLLADPATDLTINGCHLSRAGYARFAEILFRGTFAAAPMPAPEPLRLAVVDLERQFFRRYRPLNTFYYTGGRNKDYGYLDFLPAMRGFDILCANRDRRIWDIAHGRPVPPVPDDSNLPAMPPVNETRGANEWLPAEKEREAFRVDPRFAVNLFAGEERFPEIANPIQCRWDSRGRMWVSTSQAYPHVYPGAEPRDRLVILEDTDGDGRADTAKVFADDLHLPLSFEFGDGGVYVSEQPHLTFLADTDGDDRADVHEVILSGFGTEDSHHALHDFVWAPDGALLIRESVFHHSQVETPYGPVRQNNSGFFRYEPRLHRLTSFGSYPSTNPWGVTFDPWGNHVASHPIFAEAFHALDPPYPRQHAAPRGLQAYSGTCGQAFVDADGFPATLKGGFVKARYKPTNRIEIHQWVEGEFGFDERYVGDLLFSTNLSFIPVDLHFGPRGDLFVVDWYNPVKGHAQYSLRDSRRNRESGRIWRIVPRDEAPGEMPRIAGAAEGDLAALLVHPEHRVRYLATRELTTRERGRAAAAIDALAGSVRAEDPAGDRTRLAAMWAASSIGAPRPELVAGLFASADHHARAAAIRQVRAWREHLPDAEDLLDRAARDPAGLVRLEAAVAGSWVGSRRALEAVLAVCERPLGGHLAYAAAAALESHTLRRHWADDPGSPVPRLLKRLGRGMAITPAKPTAAEAAFDAQAGVAEVRIGCEPERMLFTPRRFTVAPGQPVKIVFTNPDATDHNLVIVRPGTLEAVGTAANEMARDPRNAAGDFLPESHRESILQATPMIGPTRKALAHVLRFTAPTEPGVYPYVCTFPGHWVVMNGRMVVARDEIEAEALEAACRPAFVRAWRTGDFAAEDFSAARDDAAIARGMHAFAKAQCTQCHAAAGHAASGAAAGTPALGPNLVETLRRHRGRSLLEQILEPSREIHEKYRTEQFLLTNGRLVAGIVREETPEICRVVPNLLAPETVVTVRKSDVQERMATRQSAMPAGLLDVLTRREILDLLAFVEAGADLPPGLRHEPQRAPAAAARP